MKTMRFLPVLLFLAFGTSCVPLGSVYSLWDKEHDMELPGLEGTWTESDGGTLTIVRDEGGFYGVAYADNEKVSHYEVHVVGLNGTLFMDFYPAEDTLEKRLDFKDETYLPLIPAHFFSRIILKGDALQLALLDDEIVEKKAASGEITVPLLKWKDGLVLTAETKDVQKLLARLANDASIWVEEEEFTRKKN